MALERTLSIIKPDAVAKNVIGEIAHRVDAIDEPAMDPGERLSGAERLLAALDEESRERCLIEVEKVDHETKALPQEIAAT